MTGKTKNTDIQSAGGTVLSEQISRHLDEAEEKAWDALSRYKPMMFGYWCAIWIHLNRISGQKRPNPWRQLVQMARDRMSEAKRDPAPPPKGVS